MIQATLSGKSKGYEYTEDILTSTVFGMLKYLPSDAALIPFIESAFLYDEKRTALWQVFNSEGIELRCYNNVSYFFWAGHPKLGEPDLVLIFSDHVHGEDDLLIIIEAKFKSEKSSTGEHDQLVRYLNAVNEDIQGFAEGEISSFRGKKGYIIYLTEHEAHKEICDSKELLKAKSKEAENKIFHLRWHQLYKTLEKVTVNSPYNEKIIAKDLLDYLERIGLRDFSGISLPGDNLIKAISLSYPVFYQSKDKNKQDAKYFDDLPDINIINEKICFYGGK